MTNMGKYADEIIKNFNEKGILVEYVEATHKISKEKQTKLYRLLRFFNNDLKIGFMKRKFHNISKEYYKELIKYEENVDFFLDIGGKSSIGFLKELKKKTNCRKKLFLWDDIKYNREVLKKIEYFDEVYTYNDIDSEKYGLQFRPSFFLKIFEYDNSKKDIDVFYVGSWRDKKRAELLIKLKKKLKKRLELFLIEKHKNNFIRKFLRKPYGEIIKNKSLNIEEISEKYKKSEILLDIQFKKQSGLSLRIIESIATHSKVITTNKNVKKYDFYKFNNIYLLDETNIDWVELNSFIDTEFTNYPKDIKEKYSFGGFLRDILTKGEGDENTFTSP